MSPASKIDVVGVGLNATDTLIPVTHFPAPGSKVEFRSANVLPGGQVATAMVACQSWGLRPRYVGKTRDDPAPAPPRPPANPGDCAHATSTKSATTPPPPCIAPNSPASASRPIYSVRRAAP